MRFDKLYTSLIPQYMVTVVFVRLLRVNDQTTQGFEQFSNRTFHIVSTAEQFGTISVFFCLDSALQHCYHHWTAFVISIYLKLSSSPAIQILIFSFLASTYNDLTSGSCPQAVVPWSHDLPTLPNTAVLCCGYSRSQSSYLDHWYIHANDMDTTGHL